MFQRFFLDRKFLWVRWLGEYHGFPSQIFCSTVPKNIRRGNPSVFHPFQVAKYFMNKRGMS